MGDPEASRDKTEIKYGSGHIRFTERTTLQEEKLKYPSEAGDNENFHLAGQHTQDWHDKTQFAGVDKFKDEQIQLKGVAPVSAPAQSLESMKKEDAATNSDTNANARLQLLRRERKVCGGEVQLCMLCPRPVYPHEPWDECCEFCYAEVRPVLDPELLNRKRCELHALLAAV